MNRITVRFAAMAMAAIVGVAAISGCSEDPQEKYNEALEQLKDARASRDDAQDQLKSQKEELAELKSKLDKAQGELKDADQSVDKASQNVDKTVNDQVLFRTIQRELLNKDEFDEAAISVGVKQRVVTLTGNVPDKETHQQAVKLAKSQAGVKNVVDNLTVAKADSQPTNAGDNSAGQGEGSGGQKDSQGDKSQSSGNPGQGDDSSKQGGSSGAQDKPNAGSPQPDSQG